MTRSTLKEGPRLLFMVRSSVLLCDARCASSPSQDTVLWGFCLHPF